MLFGKITGSGAKRLAAALMLCALAACLGGCAAQIEERTMTDVTRIPIEPGMDAPTADAIADRQTYATLYFLSEDARSLVPVARELSIPGGVTRARAVLEALLAGPAEGEAGVWPDLGLPIVARSLEVSGGVAIVDLPARVRTLPQETLYAMRMAITNTLTEMGDIRAVNVLIGGREEGFDLGATLPVGTLLRAADLDVGAAYDRLDAQRQSGGGFAQMTTLYLPAADGHCVLARVRSVDYAQTSPIEYLYTLLEELGALSGSQGAAAFPAPMAYINEMPEIVRTEDGAYRAIEIRFEAALDDALAGAGLTRGAYMAMLTHTLMGAVPGVEGLKVHIGEEVLTGLSAEQTPGGEAIVFEHTLATRGDFAAMIGSPVTVYAIDAQTGRLTAEQRVLPQEKSASPRALMETLLAMWSDRAAMASLTGADILAISVCGDEIAVNLSPAFGDALRRLSDREARAAVYAMVNTLTEGSGRGGVTFFFGGKQMEEPLGGVEMRGRLARNPGLVVE